MQISNFVFLPVLCMGLFVSAAMAEELAVPDKEHRQGMSYEEYSHYREKMRKHMEKMHPAERRQTPEQTEKINPNSAYGQGYRSRNPNDDRPDISIVNKPDHPRVERFNRSDLGRPR